MKKGILKKLVSVVMAMGMCFSVVACGATGGNDKSSGESTEKTLLDEIKEDGKLVLGTSADYPPYEFIVNGEIVGFDLEIAKEIAKDLGVELEIQDMKFDSLVAALQSGTIDMVISGMNPTPERQEAVDFSDIYYKAEHGIVVKKDMKDTYKSKDDLKGKKIVAQKGSVQEELANTQIEDGQVKALGKVPDLVLEVVSGNADAAIMEVPVANANASANGELFVIEKPGFELDDSEQGSAVAVPKDSPELIAEVNKTIDRLVSEGKIEEFIIDANKLMEESQAE